MKVQFTFEGMVPAHVNDYVLVLKNKLSSISSYG